jgi:hypothetical protein
VTRGRRSRSGGGSRERRLRAFCVSRNGGPSGSIRSLKGTCSSPAPRRGCRACRDEALAGVQAGVAELDGLLLSGPAPCPGQAVIGRRTATALHGLASAVGATLHVATGQVELTGSHAAIRTAVHVVSFQRSFLTYNSTASMTRTDWPSQTAHASYSSGSHAGLSPGCSRRTSELVGATSPERRLP